MFDKVISFYTYSHLVAKKDIYLRQSNSVIEYAKFSSTATCGENSEMVPLAETKMHLRMCP